MSISKTFLILVMSLSLNSNLWSQTHTGGSGGEPDDYPTEYEYEKTFIQVIKNQWKKCRLRRSPPQDIVSFYQYFNPEKRTLDPNEILHDVFHPRRDCRQEKAGHRHSRHQQKLECLMTKEAKKPLSKLLQNDEIDSYLQKGHGLSAAEAQKIKIFYIDLILGD